MIVWGPELTRIRNGGGSFETRDAGLDVGLYVCGDGLRRRWHIPKNTKRIRFGVSLEEDQQGVPLAFIRTGGTGEYRYACEHEYNGTSHLYLMQPPTHIRDLIARATALESRTPSNIWVVCEVIA